MDSVQTKPSSSPVTLPAKGPILLADDSQNDVEIFRRAYRKAGFQNPLHVVHDGNEAIRYLLGEGQYADRTKFPMPRLLLLDSQMPIMSGCEVLEWLQGRPEFKELIVIMLGGSGSPNEEVTAIRLGAKGYYMKPQTPAELEQLVKRICGNWELPGSARCARLVGLEP